MKESNEQEQAPVAATTQKKSTGFIVAIVILFIAIIGLAVTEVLAYQEMTKKDDEISSLKNQIKKADSTKEDEIEKEEESEQQEIKDNTIPKSFKIEQAKLDKKIEATNKNNIFNISKIEFTNDNKYIIAMGSITVNGGLGGAISTWYKSTEEGSEWKELYTGQAFIECTKYSEEQLKIMEDYKYIDDDLNNPFFGCIDENGKDWPDGFKN